MLKDLSRGNTQIILKPGLVGLVKYLAGSAGLRHATVGKFWLDSMEDRCRGEAAR
jgi:hypothetical protein